jgi:hypothetical protein
VLTLAVVDVDGVEDLPPLVTGLATDGGGMYGFGAGLATGSGSSFSPFKNFIKLSINPLVFALPLGPAAVLVLGEGFAGDVMFGLTSFCTPFV